MKTKFNKFIPLVIGFVMAMSACSDDDSTDPEPSPSTPKPVVNVTISGDENQDSYSVEQGQGVNFVINALSASGGGAKLDKIQMNQSGANEIITPGDITFISEDGTEFDFATNDNKDIKNSENENLKISKQFADGSSISTNSGTTTYTITLTDDDGVISTREFDINVYTSFSTTETGSIYHIKGKKDGSYSLTTDTTISAGNASIEADISNTDAAGSAFTGSFKIGDTRALDEDLVRVPAGGYDYDRGSMEEAQDVYDAGTPVTSISNPAADDMYIFKLPITGDLAVVKITAVEPGNNDCSCNNPGKMTFEYKK